MTVEGFEEELTEQFATLSEELESHVLARLLLECEPFSAYRFEIDSSTIRGLLHVFRTDHRLWADFQAAVCAHRRQTHWSMLVENVHAVGSLTGKQNLLDYLINCPGRDDRRATGDLLNDLGGEIAFCQELADRRDLAKRVNRAIGFPLIDGLLLRGLTYVLGENTCLLDALRALVGQSAGVAGLLQSSPPEDL